MTSRLRQGLDLSYYLIVERRLPWSGPQIRRQDKYLPEFVTPAKDGVPHSSLLLA
jgi:hypothetical protein